MHNYTPTKTWSTPREWDSTDTSDAATVLNLPIQDLANRTEYLYDMAGRFENLVTFDNSTSSGVASPTVANLYRSLYRVFLSTTSNYATINIPSASTFPANAHITIVVSGSANVPVKISAFSGQTIYWPTGQGQDLYLHLGERVTLYRNGTNWEVIFHSGNLTSVGQQRFGYVQEFGTVLRNGQIYLRALYPRLWALVSANPSLIVTESQWTTPGTAGLQYQSFFSSGDGSTTFRVPDDRGLFERALDLARGTDADRFAASLYGVVGSFQADQLKSHQHSTQIDVWTGSGVAGGSAVQKSPGTSTPPIISATGFTGGTETRPINVGKLPLIVY